MNRGMDTASLQHVSGASATTMTREESLQRLHREAVGRVCIEVDDYPVAFPVNYVVDDSTGGNRIVIRTAPDSVIGSYRGLASLEVDRIDLAAGRAWSVIVLGELAPIVGRPPNQDPRPFVSDQRTRWMELDIGPVSGRRFVADTPGFVVEWQLEPSTGA